ncbi:hypothetical protein CDAR_440661 [Caerostris darwini]|uniref:Uncharacterized protein n=1 Tax=Caerostris darwini TaxID=1538125 RepID=A0AAV4ML60_9ARAC|nr:hypothetical protein CDAR_440661 [Caerostris darwini]
MPPQSSHNIAFLPLKPYFPSHPTCSIKNRKRGGGKGNPGKRRVSLISTFSCSSSYPPGKPKKDHLAHEIVIDRSFFPAPNCFIAMPLLRPTANFTAGSKSLFPYFCKFNNPLRCDTRITQHDAPNKQKTVNKDTKNILPSHPPYNVEPINAFRLLFIPEPRARSNKSYVSVNHGPLLCLDAWKAALSPPAIPFISPSFSKSHSENPSPPLPTLPNHVPGCLSFIIQLMAN